MNESGCKILAAINKKRSIDEFTDDILLEILYRVDCYGTALRCKPVCKRWYSLISNPSFLTEARSRAEEVEEESRTFMITAQMSWNRNFLIAMAAPPFYERQLCSPVLSLRFLPYPTTLVSTYEDLILCFGVNPVTDSGEYYVCNPLTKQWMAFPHCECQVCQQRRQPSIHGGEPKPPFWAGLVCQEGRGFRVLVIPHKRYLFCYDDNEVAYRLLIYLSETCQWKHVNLRVKLHGERFDRCDFRGVVCNGLVCLCCGSRLGAFNPFDVTPNFQGTTLAAISLPLFRGLGMLTESNGNLVTIDDSYIKLRSRTTISQEHLYDVNKKGAKSIWKLNLRRLENDEQPLRWELITLLHPNVKGPRLAPFEDDGDELVLKFAGVHPNKEHMAYFIPTPQQTHQNQLFMYDSNSGMLDAYPSPIDPSDFFISQKLVIPAWPTPIPIT